MQFNWIFHFSPNFNSVLQIDVVNLTFKYLDEYEAH